MNSNNQFSTNKRINEHGENIKRPKKKKRTAGEMKKRAEMKKQKFRTITTSLPYTPGLSKQKRKDQKKRLFVVVPTLIKEPIGTPILRFFNRLIPATFMQTLTLSTSALVGLQTPGQHTTKRGFESVFHFGFWRKYMPFPQQTSESETKAAQDWMHQNVPLFMWLAKIFRLEFTDLFNEYTSIPEEYRPFVAWTTCALNINFAVAPHRDWDDYRGGLCWVIPFGDFTGGSLFLEDFNIEICCQPGDIIAFRSYWITHEVLDFFGERNSLVLFTGNTMYYSGDDVYSSGDETCSEQENSEDDYVYKSDSDD